MSNLDAFVRIYALRDPRNQDIRYVGKTVKSLKARLQIHVASSGYYARRHVCHWIKELQSLSLYPSIELLEEVDPGKDWAARERYWIAKLRNDGCRLTNLTEGGDGCHGIKRSPASIEKTAAAHRGKTISAEQRRKQSIAMKGRKLPEHRKRQISEFFRGRPLKPETIEKMRIARRRRPLGEFSGQRNGRCKLTDLQVGEIRGSNLTLSEIMRRYGIGKSQASRLRRGLVRSAA